MHDIGFVETIFMIFRLWTVSSYSYIKRLPLVSSCSPDALNVLKTAKFCSSLIDLCHQSYHARYWVCRDYNYGVPTLDSVSIIIAISLPQFMTFRQHLILECWPRNTYCQIVSSSNDLCQSSHHARYWVCRDSNYHFPTLSSFFSFLYRKAAPGEQLCSWRI